MRITGGRFKGRSVPIGLAPGVRPTSSRVREALFSMLGSDLSGWSFLDLFGGAGLMGLEALSRGAAVTVVEKNGRAFRDILERGKALKVEWTVKKGDALKLMRDFEPFDVVFVDPPYKMDMAPLLVDTVVLARHSLVAEFSAGFEPPPILGHMTLDRHRVYGGTALAVYRTAEG